MSGTADFVATNLTELHERVGIAHRRFAEVARSVSPSLPVDADWSVSDTVGHLVTVIDRYLAFRPDRIAAEPRGVDEINARELSGLAESSVVALLERLDSSVVALRAAWGALPLDMRIPFHGGGTIDVQSGLTNALGEFLVHGFDIAAAAGVAWPIDERDGLLLLGFGTQILPAYVKATNEGTAIARLEVDGAPAWHLAVHGPHATSRPAEATDEADVVLDGPATALVLAFYGRAVHEGAPEFFDRFERP